MNASPVDVKSQGERRENPRQSIVAPRARTPRDPALSRRAQAEGIKNPYFWVPGGTQSPLLSRPRSAEPRGCEGVSVCVDSPPPAEPSSGETSRA
jgi:hypothetical protein